MLSNVLYDRKNMLYEELLEHITTNQMLVTCCIDAHFTAFQVLPKRSLIYYDPLRPGLQYLSGDSYNKFASFLLLKCNYGDSQHIQENKDYYTGADANPTRRMIYFLWREINKLEVNLLSGVRQREISLNLDEYFLVNNARNPRMMSTQETGNTCYFQTYLFAVLCKVGVPALARDSASLDLQDVGKLAETTVAICRFLLEFFVQDDDADGTADKVMRPLTNSNFVIDFRRYEHARYYAIVTQYLQRRHESVPDYDQQYHKVLKYFVETRTLHKYGKFTLTGTMSSTPNTKSLQPVTGTDDAVYKLGRSHYYKYRAANLMFGFNTGILSKLRSFCSFNALRKNQLLAFYKELSPLISEVRTAATTTKYRDYYFMPQFEIGQQELVDVHHYTYAIDIFSMLVDVKMPNLAARVHAVNQVLVEQIYFSTQKLANYEKFMTTKEFQTSRKYYEFFLDRFLTVEFLNDFAGLGNFRRPLLCLHLSLRLIDISLFFSRQGSARSTRKRRKLTH